jgi:hypothetical protein
MEPAQWEPKSTGRFTISHNLPVTRRCFHPRVIHSHPMDVTLGPDPYRGYLPPLRRGLLLWPGNSLNRSKAFVRAGVDGTLLDPSIDLSPPACAGLLSDSYRQA